MVEYYRGLCTFEDAVNAVEETGLATSQAINNLETGITNAIQEMALGIRTDIQQNSYAIVASHKMLADSFVNGFNSINNTLNFSFGYLGNKIDVLSDKICSKLDKIHDILNNPRLTASRELYRNALKDFQNRYYEEALENCTEAIEKNKTDYISWFLLGMIYFCGKSKFSNVLDIKKAEEAFFNAAKYVDAVIGKTEEANIFASEIYYYLGHTRLIISNDYLIENKIEESNKKLLEAEEASRTSYQLSKENLLARYEQAKHLHFLGNDKESLWILEELIRAEKNFAIKSINDKNFESLWGDIRKIIDKLKQELWIPINKKIEESIKKYEGNFEFVFSDYPEIFSKHGFSIDSLGKASNEIRLKYKNIFDKQTYFDTLDYRMKFNDDEIKIYNDVSDFFNDYFYPAYSDIGEIQRKQEEEEQRRKKEEERIREEQRRQLRQEEEEKKRKEEKLLKKRIRRIKASIIISSFLLGILIGIIGIVVFQNMNIEVMSIEEVLPLSGWICLAVGFLYFVLRFFYKGLGNFLGCFLGSLPIAFISFIGSLFFMACVGEGEDLLLLISIVVSTVFFLLFGLLIAKDVDCENLNKMKIVLTILFILLVCFFCICILYYINTEQYKTNMLIKGVKQNNIKKIEQYINSGANKDKAFRTAIENGNEEIIELFIKNDISISIAIEFADKELLDLFIKNGYNINDYSILNTAILYGEVEMIEYLINLGADINTENPPIITLLRNPDRFNNDLNEATYVFDLLIKSGADVNIQSADRMQTPLMVLASEITLSSSLDPILDEWYVNIAKKLLRLGAKVNIVDSYGSAVLDYLNLRENHYEIYQLSKEEENLNKQYDQKLRDLLISYGAKMARKN